MTDRTGRGADDRRPQGDRLTLGGMLALTVGLACSFWLFLEVLRRELDPAKLEAYVFLGGLVLGGMSAVGVPWLLVDRLRRGGPRRRPWGAGRLLWFATGSAAWLLWPPVVYRRIVPANPNAVGGADSISQVCYFYGTPLMAAYMLLALWAGGHVRRRRRRGRARPHRWSERFGLALGIGWGGLGIVVLYMIYFNHFR